MQAPSPVAATSRTRLVELGLTFLWLGATAFGGPLAHVAVMKKEVVDRLGWLSDERFLDLLAAANLIPGPNSTELAIHVGWERARGPGVVVAGVAFILPAFFLTASLGALYVEYRELPALQGILDGVKPVILAVIAQALFELAPRAAKGVPERALGLGVLVALFAGLNEVLALLLAGGLGWLLANARDQGGGSIRAGFAPLLPLAAGPLGSSSSAPLVTATGAASLPTLFGVFLKTGAVLFGSGYTLVTFLEADLVDRFGFLTRAELIDAIAVGQMTPGPVFTTATFIGYLVAGPLGAVVATVGIFLPAFVFVALSAPFVPRIRKSTRWRAFLDGANVGALALLAVGSVRLARGVHWDWFGVTVLVVAAYLLVRKKVDSTWLIAGGALLGTLRALSAGWF